jgi:AraC-like DNA-binding protein
MQFTSVNPEVANPIPAKTLYLVGEINEILQTSIGDHPSFDMLASAFKMSGRTLRRQLAGAGTSYQKLVDNFRCDHAISCLRETNMSTEDIAERLGFSDVANFRHAFKKWVGESPAAYRARLTQAA